VRCTYELADAQRSVFDFDLVVLPKHRMGIGFMAICTEPTPISTSAASATPSAADPVQPRVPACPRSPRLAPGRTRSVPEDVGTGDDVDIDPPICGVDMVFLAPHEAALDAAGT
jgi:hypothetical protein